MRKYLFNGLMIYVNINKNNLDFFSNNKNYYLVRYYNETVNRI